MFTVGHGVRIVLCVFILGLRVSNTQGMLLTLTYIMKSTKVQNPWHISCTKPIIGVRMGYALQCSCTLWSVLAATQARASCIGNNA